MSISTPRLADGTPFRLGMTVYLPVGGIDGDGEIRCIETDPATHEIESFIHDGLRYNCLQLKGSRTGNDTGFFYPSRAAVLDARIKRLESDIAVRRDRLEQMKTERELGS
jgi:hypothetical protein